MSTASRFKISLLLAFMILSIGSVASINKAFAGDSKDNSTNEGLLENYLFNLYNQQKQEQQNQLPRPNDNPPPPPPPPPPPE